MEVIKEKRDGYKKTKVGWIPEEWRMKSFKDVTIINQGLQIAISERLLKRVENSHFYITNEFLKSDSQKEYFILNPSKSVLCDTSDILMTRTGNTGQVVTGVSGAFHNNFFKIKFDKDELVKDFLYYYLISHKTQSTILKYAGTSAIPDLNHSDFYRINIPLPNLLEQKKIASILSDWDKAILITQKLIDKLKERKKGIMQQLFNGELRLLSPNDESFSKWTLQKLGYYLEHSKEKNTNLKFKKADVLSVSGKYGIVNQIEFHGRSFAGVSVANYGVVEKGDIVYTKSPLKANPYGIIKVNKHKGGIVSTLYAVYKCKSTVSGEFLDYYFQLDDNLNSYLRPLVQKGTKNDMKINNEKVLSDNVLFPSKEEQEVIVCFLKKIDVETEIVKKKLLKLKKQKKGLMQQLLTGKIRVKV